MTAVLGGIFRHVFCNEVLLILREEIYATACIFGGVLFFILRYFSIDQNIIYIVTILFIITIRMLSVKYNLSLPKFKDK